LSGEGEMALLQSASGGCGREGGGLPLEYVGRCKFPHVFVLEKCWADRAVQCVPHLRCELALDPGPDAAAADVDGVCAFCCWCARGEAGLGASVGADDAILGWTGML
jgi:hypothetical protein